MTSKFIKIALVGALAIAPTMPAFATGTGAVGASTSGGVTATPNTRETSIQKQTDPKENGTDQSESRGSQNKNGQPR